MKPYPRRTVTEDEHAFFMALADYIADRSANALARKSFRLGQAHKYLLAAHLAALMDGMGDDDALAFLDQVVSDFTRAADG